MSPLIWPLALAPIDLRVAKGDSRATWSMLNSGSCSSPIICGGEADRMGTTAQLLGMSQSLLRIRTTAVYLLVAACGRWAPVSILVASVLIALRTLECDKSLLVIIESVVGHAASVCSRMSYIVSRTVVVDLGCTQPACEDSRLNLCQRMSPPRRSISRRALGSGYKVFAAPLLREVRGISACETGTVNSQTHCHICKAVWVYLNIQTGPDCPTTFPRAGIALGTRNC
jgi:hypothetical protein